MMKTELRRRPKILRIKSDFAQSANSVDLMLFSRESWAHFSGKTAFSSEIEIVLLDPAKVLAPRFSYSKWFGILVD
jgi:hypothetical protein